MKFLVDAQFAADEQALKTHSLMELDRSEVRVVA